jgi:putative flippase GtrA
VLTGRVGRLGPIHCAIELVLLYLASQQYEHIGTATIAIVIAITINIISNTKQTIASQLSPSALHHALRHPPDFHLVLYFVTEHGLCRAPVGSDAGGCCEDHHLGGTGNDGNTHLL